MSYTRQNIRPYLSLGDIIHTFKAELGDYGMHNYSQYFSLAARCLTDINIHDLRQVRVHYGTIDSDLNTIPLPDDLENIIRVGVNVNERMWIIPQNRNIVIPREEDCGEEERDVDASNANINPTGESSSRFYSHWRNGGWVSNLYGTFGGFSDLFYRYDKERNRLLLEGNLSTDYDVVIEYVSTGISTSDETIIPLYVQEAILAYLRWKVAENVPTMSEGKIMRFMQIYNEERARIIRKKHSFR